MDRLAWVCLKQAVGAEETSCGARDVIGGDFQGAEHAAVVDEGPSDMTDPLDREAFGDSLELNADGRDFNRANKIRSVWRDRDTGARVPDDWEAVGGVAVVPCRRRG